MSDIKHRSISTAWPGAFALAGLGAAAAVYGLRGMLMNAAGNILVIIYLASGILLYLKVKQRLLRQEGTFWEYAGNCIGFGDVLFLIALTPFFPFKEFLIFLTASSFVTLTGWAIFVSLTRRQPTIPLVAAFSICLCIYLIIKMTAV